MEHKLHPSEAAAAERELHWNKDRLEPKVAPGSHEEALALESIDRRRDEELAGHGDTFAARRIRARRAWRKIL